MLIRYVSLAPSTQAAVIADLAALASGASIASLSASCDKANTVILNNDMLPGWSLTDGPNGVITAPDADNKTTKVARFTAASTSAIGMSAFETWDAAAHTGTNPATGGSAAICPVYSTSVVNTYILYVEPRLVLLTANDGKLQGVAEVARDTPALIGGSYPVTVTINASLGTTQMPRIKNPAAAGDLTAAPVVISTPLTVTAQNTPILDHAEVPYHPINPMWVTRAVGANAGVILGKLFSLYMTTQTYGGHLDEMTDGVSSYLVLANAAASRMVVRKG
jgi:hypothetical protein